MTRLLHILPLMVLAALAMGQGAGGSSRPASNLDYWLGQASTASAAAGVTEPSAADPRGTASKPAARADALPGVVGLSDGQVLAGMIYTTLDKDLEVWVESQKRFRHVPPLLALSVSAVAVNEEMEKEWRWKEMGSDDRVETGRSRPIRRLEWKLHLIDDSTLVGSIKGQPIWVRAADGKTAGPFVLNERQAGEYGQKLADLVYIKQIVFSRRAMEEAGK